MRRPCHKEGPCELNQFRFFTWVDMVSDTLFWVDQHWCLAHCTNNSSFSSYILSRSLMTIVDSHGSISYIPNQKFLMPSKSFLNSLTTSFLNPLKFCILIQREKGGGHILLIFSVVSYKIKVSSLKRSFPYILLNKMVLLNGKMSSWRCSHTFVGIINTTIILSWSLINICASNQLSPFTETSASDSLL